MKLDNRRVLLFGAPCSLRWLHNN